MARAWGEGGGQRGRLSCGGSESLRLEGKEEKWGDGEEGKEEEKEGEEGKGRRR